MPITRKLISQDHEDCQNLRVNVSKKYIENSSEDWQMLFSTKANLNGATRFLKIAAELDTNTLENLRFTAYLYNPVTKTADPATDCTFRVYLVNQPGWTESLLSTFAGSPQSNQYFYADILNSSIPSASIDGDSTLMIEAELNRLGKIYTDRIYVNHLGVYDSIVRLRNDVEFLDITKLDE